MCATITARSAPDEAEPFRAVACSHAHGTPHQLQRRLQSQSERGREEPGAGERTRPLLSLHPAKLERQTDDRSRDSMAWLCAALGVVTGLIAAKCSRRRRNAEFCTVPIHIRVSGPPDLSIHIDMALHSTLQTQMIRDWRALRVRQQVHFIPTSISHFNQVARPIVEVTQQLCRHEAHRFFAPPTHLISLCVAPSTDDLNPSRSHTHVDEVLPGTGWSFFSARKSAYATIATTRTAESQC